MTAVELAGQVDAPVSPRTTPAHARLAVVSRYAVTVVVGTLVMSSVWRHRQQLDTGLHLLKHLSWWWLAGALVAQGASIGSFALLQRRLLRAGDVNIAVFDMAKISFAANAISGSLPGGAAWSAPWSWRQLRQRGADRGLATWVVLASGVFSSLALFVIVVAGTELAGSHGPVASLRWLDRTLAGLVVTTAVVVAATRARHNHRRATGRLAALRDRIAMVHLGVGGWATSISLAMANWLLDLACLIACIAAVGSGVDWRPVVVVYALTQLIAVLPITPGGIGVVEAGLTALLIAYGMPATAAIATVVLYRALTFWLLIPGGWVAYWQLARRPGPALLTTPALRAPMTFEQTPVLVAGVGTTAQAP